MTDPTRAEALPIATDVRGCARCGGEHLRLEFLPFHRPVGLDTHWAPCPQTEEPVLLRVVRRAVQAPAGPSEAAIEAACRARFADGAWDRHDEGWSKQAQWGMMEAQWGMMEASLKAAYAVDGVRPPSAAELRVWSVTGPHNGEPPWAVGFAPCGPVVWFYEEHNARRACNDLNDAEKYVRARPTTPEAPAPGEPITDLMAAIKAKLAEPTTPEGTP